MVVCPVALAVGCRKCPVFRICPAKSIIGDFRADESARTTKDDAGKAAGKKPSRPNKK